MAKRKNNVIKKAYIYFLVDENNNPFYVGKTVDPPRRKRSHKRNAKNGNKLPKYNKLRKLFRQEIDISDETKEKISDAKKERNFHKVIKKPCRRQGKVV